MVVRLLVAQVAAVLVLALVFGAITRAGGEPVSWLLLITLASAGVGVGSAIGALTVGRRR